MYMRILYRLRDAIKFRVFRPLLLSVGKMMGRFSVVGDHPVFDPTLFSWVKMLEDNWLSIRKELDQLLPHRQGIPSIQQIQQEQMVLNKDDNWKTFFPFWIWSKGCTELCSMSCHSVDPGEYSWNENSLFFHSFSA